MAGVYHETMPLWLLADWGSAVRGGVVKIVCIAWAHPSEGRGDFNFES